jgi:hypothetical protein
VFCKSLFIVTVFLNDSNVLSTKAFQIVLNFNIFFSYRYCASLFWCCLYDIHTGFIYCLPLFMHEFNCNFYCEIYIMQHVWCSFLFLLTHAFLEDIDTFTTSFNMDFCYVHCSWYTWFHFLIEGLMIYCSNELLLSHHWRFVTYSSKTFRAAWSQCFKSWMNFLYSNLLWHIYLYIWFCLTWKTCVTLSVVVFITQRYCKEWQNDSTGDQNTLE